MKGRKPNVLASRIKKMMQADDEVGKIAQDTPVLIGHAMELFLQQLCKGASALALERGDKTLTPAHLKAFVSGEASLDFLRSIVESAPDLPDKSAAPARKRQRTTKTGEEGAKGRGKGKGKGKGAAAGEAGKEEAGAEAGPSADVKPEPGAIKAEDSAAAAGDGSAAGLPSGSMPAAAAGGAAASQPGGQEAAAAAPPALPSALLAGAAATTAGVEDEDDYDED